MEERSYFAVKGGQGVTTLAVADAVLTASDNTAVGTAATPFVHLVTHDLAETCTVANSPHEGDGVMARVLPNLWVISADHLSDLNLPAPDVIIHDLGVSPQADEMHGRKLLVTRPCYLALSRAVAKAPTVDGVVLAEEPERSLNRSDVEAVIGRPVVATVPYDPAVARAVDSGLLAMRVPRSLAQAVRQVVETERVGGKL